MSKSRAGDRLASLGFSSIKGTVHLPPVGLLLVYGVTPQDAHTPVACRYESGEKVWTKKENPRPAFQSASTPSGTVVRGANERAPSFRLDWPTGIVLVEHEGSHARIGRVVHASVGARTLLEIL
jgi:hypothetical protein